MMRKSGLALLLILICGCSERSENVSYESYTYTDTSTIPIEESQDGFLLIGLFTYQQMDEDGESHILRHKIFTHSLARPEADSHSKQGKIQVDYTHNVLRLETNLVSWWVDLDLDFSEFDFYNDVIPENSLNVVARKKDSKDGISESLTVNYYLSDRPKLLELQRKMGETRTSK